MNIHIDFSPCFPQEGTLQFYHESCPISEMTIRSLVQRNLFRETPIPYLLAEIKYTKEGRIKHRFADGIAVLNKVKEVHHFDILKKRYVVSQIDFFIIDGNCQHVYFNWKIQNPFTHSQELIENSEINDAAAVFTLPIDIQTHKAQIRAAFKSATVYQRISYALRLIDIAFSLDLRNSNALFLKGVILSDLCEGVEERDEGDPLIGEELIKEACLINPQIPFYAFALALLKINQGKIEKIKFSFNSETAQLQVDASVEEKIMDYWGEQNAYTFLAKAYLIHQTDKDDAIRLLDLAMRRFPNNRSLIEFSNQL